jgi:hypothetical protein
MVIELKEGKIPCGSGMKRKEVPTLGERELAGNEN